MVTLEELKSQLDVIFDCDELVVPEPSAHWKRKLDALEEADLTTQSDALIFDMRCEQARQMGFSQIKTGDMVEILMGEVDTGNEVPKDTSKQLYRWMMNHHTGIITKGDDCSWGSRPHDWFCIKRMGLWYKPPFAKKEVWRCRMGKLNKLQREIPYGVVLRLNELKELKLFNAFSVIAPIEVWEERKTDIDPIVMATMWELPLDDKGKRNSSGQTAHFFVAQW